MLLVLLGYLICHQIVLVRRSENVDKLIFENMLTQYLRMEKVDEELELDMIIPAAL